MTAVRPHMCVGLSCWECGEPTELREIRQRQIVPALYEVQQEMPGADHHRLARAAAQAIRPGILRAITDRAMLVEALRSMTVTHKTLNGAHDNNLRDGGCQGCALIAEIRDHLTRPA